MSPVKGQATSPAQIPSPRPTQKQQHRISLTFLKRHGSTATDKAREKRAQQATAGAQQSSQSHQPDNGKASYDGNAPRSESRTGSRLGTHHEDDAVKEPSRVPANGVHRQASFDSTADRPSSRMSGQSEDNSIISKVGSVKKRFSFRNMGGIGKKPSKNSVRSRGERSVGAVDEITEE
jgi:type II secretory pathway pseudopilin PulG